MAQILSHLPKSLGTGIISTAIKKGLVSEDVVIKMVKIMAFLNKYASESMLEVGINACTDMIDFGLCGHLCEMVEASKVGAKIYVSKVPIIESALKLAKERIVPGGTLSNLMYAEKKVAWDEKVINEEKLILGDAQTSGGLLVSVPKEKERELLRSLISKGVSNSVVIGEMIEEEKCRIQVIK